VSGLALQGEGWDPPLHKKDIHFSADFRRMPDKYARGVELWINIAKEPFSERPVIRDV
jgi:hypothetical protein